MGRHMTALSPGPEVHLNWAAARQDKARLKTCKEYAMVLIYANSIDSVESGGHYIVVSEKSGICHFNRTDRFLNVVSLLKSSFTCDLSL